MWYTTNATIQAITHCPITIVVAHLPPNSRFTDAIAATHGVYNKQNTSKEITPATVRLLCSAAVPPYKTVSEDTTLSFARNPEINAVTILQSPNPIGTKIGANTPATPANILF